MPFDRNLLSRLAAHGDAIGGAMRRSSAISSTSHSARPSHHAIDEHEW